MKLAPGVLAALAVIAALVVAKECGYRAGRAEAEARQRDRRDDSTVARLAFELAESEKAFMRQRDSTGRVIRALVRTIRRDSLGKIATHGSTALQLPESVADSIAIALQLAMRDSVIAAYDAGRQQDSLALLFWQRQVQQRDSLLTTIRTARDAWRELAQRPSYLVTDVGGGAIAGWGLAEKNETAVFVGAGVVLVPRLLGGLRRLF